MKNFLLILVFLLPLLARAATPAYNTTDLSLLPTNLLRSNLVDSVTVTWSMGPLGRMTANAAATPSTNLDNLTVTNLAEFYSNVNIGGALTTSRFQNTNEATFFGLVTNHATWRGSNIFDGGWLEVTGNQTNRGTLQVAGEVNASILRVTNETTHVGLTTNHTTSFITNQLNGGWHRVEGPSTNVQLAWHTNIFNGGWLHNTGNLTNSGTVRATNGLVVPSAGGLTLGTGATITNILVGSASLNFPSTGASAKADLSITVTGTTEGDEAFVGVPASAAQVTGNFTWYTSNNTVWVRFFSGAAAQNPADAVFKATVFKR